TLDEAADNPLLRAILTGSRSGDTGLLPFLTTRGDAIIAGGTGVVGDWVRRRRPDIDGNVVDDAVDAVVRLTVSHLVPPGLSHDPQCPSTSRTETKTRSCFYCDTLSQSFLTRGSRGGRR